jgi:hypothetical protein
MATKELEMSCGVLLEMHKVAADWSNLLSTLNAMRVDESGGRVVGLPMVKLLLRLQMGVFYVVLVVQREGIVAWMPGGM